VLENQDRHGDPVHKVNITVSAKQLCSELIKPAA